MSTIFHNRSQIAKLCVTHPQEYCGTYKRYVSTRYRILSKGENMGNRKVCSLPKRYEREFHTHPQKKLFHPSVKDLTQPLRYHMNLKCSQVFGVVYDTRNQKSFCRWTIKHDKTFMPHFDQAALEQILRSKIKKFQKRSKVKKVVSRRTGERTHYQMKSIRNNCISFANMLGHVIRKHTNHKYSVKVDIW